MRQAPIQLSDAFKQTYCHFRRFLVFDHPDFVSRSYKKGYGIPQQPSLCCLLSKWGALQEREQKLLGATLQLDLLENKMILDSQGVVQSYGVSSQFVVQHQATVARNEKLHVWFGLM